MSTWMKSHPMCSWLAISKDDEPMSWMTTESKQPTKNKIFKNKKKSRKNRTLRNVHNGYIVKTGKRRSLSHHNSIGELKRGVAVLHHIYDKSISEEIRKKGKRLTLDKEKHNAIIRQDKLEKKRIKQDKLKRPRIKNIKS
eukprot:84242_1